ncbi:MAG: Gfo/Idh/MocA family protein [Planctomycetota bacterium]
MEKLRIGIVGLNFGRHIVRELTEGNGAEHMEVAAVCDLDAEKAHAIGDPLGVQVYTDLADLLADETIPTVGLYTGPNGRAGLLRTIIGAGKDVMTTKPFERDIDAALAVLHEAKSAGRVLHLNSPAPVLPPDLAQIAAWRDEYDLGQAVGCRLDTWVRYNQEADGSWQDDPDQCPVAPIFRIGIYLINDVVRFLGEPEAVQVMHSRIFTGKPTPDNGQLSIRFRNGALANIYASFCCEDGDHYANAMTLNFDRGTVWRNIGPRDGWRDKEVRLALQQSRGEGERPQVVEARVGGGTSGLYQWDNFCRAVRGETLPDETTPEQVAAGLRIIEAMRRAETSGRTEPV